MSGLASLILYTLTKGKLTVISEYIPVMLIDFFFNLQKARVPVSIKELLVLLEALEKRMAFGSIDEFYILSRTVLIKDERYFDRFDIVFTGYFNGLERLDDILEVLIPDDWIRSEFLKNLSDEEKAKIESLGGLEQLIATFKERVQEQKKRHRGGSKWVGTEGSSPFGNDGENPMGLRVGGRAKNRSAIKLWEKRHYKNLDDTVKIGTRNIKVALRRLRKFARNGAAEELDLSDTISSTAKNAGFLDIKMVPERHNAVKVLLFFDIGGSMDPFIEICEELFSACRSEFRCLEYFYFHNFIYDFVWKNNLRRTTEVIPTINILHKYSRDYRIIFVGDASMSPHEIMSSYGSIEHMNEEPGAKWMGRITDAFEKIIWLNPTEIRFWEYTQSIGMVRKLLDNRMFPFTLEGLDEGIKSLSK